MTDRTPPSASDARLVVTEEDVDAVLEEFGGDHRAAIRALLHDLDVLARDHAATVSHGFVRGEFLQVVVPSRRHGRPA